MELEVAVAHWKQSFEKAKINRHPTVWIGHFSDELLGSVWATHPKDEVSTIFFLASPFCSSSQVTDTFIIRDRNHTLEITHLQTDGKGVRITPWHAPYSIADDGTAMFTRADKKVTGADGIAQHLAQARLDREVFYEFDHAFSGALELADEK